MIMNFTQIFDFHTAVLCIVYIHILPPFSLVSEGEDGVSLNLDFNEKAETTRRFTTVLGIGTGRRKALARRSDFKAL